MPDPMLEAIRLSRPAVNPLDDPALQAQIARDREVKDRFSFLPLVQTNLGMELAWPQATVDAWNGARQAVALPKAVIGGYQPTGEDIANFGLTVGMGGIGASTFARPAEGTILGANARGPRRPTGPASPPGGMVGGVGRVGRQPTQGPPTDLTGGMLGHNGGPRLDPLPPDPSIYAQPQPNNPRYTGAGVDRTPHTYLRYSPAQLPMRTTRSLEALRDPENIARMRMNEAIDRGLSPELRGQDWYNTEEARDWFIRELGEDEGHREWAQFMHMMGTASPGSNVFANIGNASMMRNRLATDPDYVQDLLETQNLEDVRRFGLTEGRPETYGHKTQETQELALARYMQGRWDPTLEPPSTGRGANFVQGVPPGKGSWTEQPKPKGFVQSLMGGERNIAADLHFTRFMALASPDNEWLSTAAEVGADNLARIAERFPGAERYVSQPGTPDGTPKFNAKRAAADGILDAQGLAEMEIPQVWASMPSDPEYKAFEDFINEIAAERGLTAPQIQAALWMGASDQTGVANVSRGTFMDIMRARAADRARKTGVPVEQVMQNFLRNKGLLSFMPAAALGAAGLYDYGQKEYQPRG